jgi:hypothetical protein
MDLNCLCKIESMIVFFTEEKLCISEKPVPFFSLNSINNLHFHCKD